MILFILTIALVLSAWNPAASKIATTADVMLAAAAVLVALALQRLADRMEALG